MDEREALWERTTHDRWLCSCARCGATATVVTRLEGRDWLDVHQDVCPGTAARLWDESHPMIEGG